MRELDNSMRWAVAACAVLFLGTLAPWQKVSGEGSAYTTGAEVFPGILLVGATVGGGYLMYRFVQSGRRDLLVAVLLLAVASLGLCVSVFIQQQFLESDWNAIDEEFGMDISGSWGLWVSCIAAFVWVAALHVHHRFPESDADPETDAAP